MTLWRVGNGGGWLLYWRRARLLCWLVLTHNYASSLLGCPFDTAWCLVCELCRLTVVWVGCRCFLSLFLGGARRLELSPCNTGPAQT